MSKQLGFFVNSMQCAGCKTCQVACKDRANLEVGQLFRKVVKHEEGDWVKRGNAWISNVTAYWLSISCNHCENPACVNVCPTGAMHKRAEDGVVMVDQDRCVGCQSCVWACPYDAPQYNPTIGKVAKCDLCADRLAEGKRPVCVDACPFQLISFGEIDKLEQEKGGTAWIKGLANPTRTKPALRINPPKGAINSPIGRDGK
ncbi:MAG TPA: DMSO/selenate family reductase complex B subunit [Symbiobacteriaceae bacterium]|nr:DMSO/selenate family reductase complex B subunit [Symbiobacteriaceae bacterium]